MHDTKTRGLIELTVLTKSGGSGPLGKRIFLDVSGKIVSDGSACTMSRGRAKRVRIDDLGELAALIENLTSKQAIALGALRDELPDEVRIVTKAALAAGVAANDAVARTAENLVYRSSRPALTLLDYDTKGMPPAVSRQLATAGGFWTALVSVIPTLATAGHLIRLSTSAGMSRTDTGEAFPGSGGLHGLVVSADGTDAVRFLKTLHARCWLAGYGWMNVGAAGQLLERSIVDRMVGAAERLVFEGPPEVVPPLHQDAAARRPTVVAGEVLDTRRRVRRCRSSNSRGSTNSRTGNASDWHPRRRRRGRHSSSGKPRSWPRATVSRRPRRKLLSCGSATAYCGRMSCCRSTTWTWPGALSAMCWRTLNASKAKRWRIRWRVSRTGPARRGSCVMPTVRRGFTRSVMARPSTSSSTTPPRSERRWRGGEPGRGGDFVRLARGADIDAVELEALRQLAKKVRHRTERDQSHAQGGDETARCRSKPRPPRSRAANGRIRGCCSGRRT